MYTRLVYIDTVGHGQFITEFNKYFKNYCSLILKNEIQSDFEGCADILSCDRTPHRVTIGQMMPYTHVNNFREKGAQSVSKKVWKPLNFMEKWVKKNHSRRLFCCHF
jgi:hypothetical protein